MRARLGQGQLLVQHHVAVSGNSGNSCCDCGLPFPKTRALSFYNSATHPTAYRLLPKASLKMVAPLSGIKEKNSEPVSISEPRPCAETSFAASSPSSVWRGLRSWLSAWPLASHQSGLCFSSSRTGSVALDWLWRRPRGLRDTGWRRSGGAFPHRVESERESEIVLETENE